MELRYRWCMAVVSSCVDVETASANWRKVRMTSSQHAPYTLGYTRNTMVETIRSDPAKASESHTPTPATPPPPHLDRAIRVHVNASLLQPQALRARFAPGRHHDQAGVEGHLLSARPRARFVTHHQAVCASAGNAHRRRAGVDLRCGRGKWAVRGERVAMECQRLLLGWQRL
eukprot:364645-Chlamydomonas_euryale.AAC.2